MYFRFTFVTVMSLFLIVLGMALRFTEHHAATDARTFCTVVGFLGWFVGNKLVELEDRLDAVEKAQEVPMGAAPSQAGPV